MKYAFLRGIYERDGKSFKIEQAGSDKSCAFCIPAGQMSVRVAVYEAAIDAMAHMSLEQEGHLFSPEMNKYRLSLGGISAPKEGARQQSSKKPAALEQFLQWHPEVTEIELCTDNDFAGRWACGHIRKAYEGSYTIIENLPKKDGADYGDLARETVRKKEGKRREDLTER